MKPALLFTAWILWCFLHSLLIADPIQAFFRTRLKAYFRFYRLFFNGFALVSLIPVLALSRSIKTPILFAWEGYGLFLFFLLWMLVLLLGYQGTRAYDMGLFSGMRQIRDAIDNEAARHFMTRGILGVVRHPWYLAALILLWVRSRQVHLAAAGENLLLTSYILIGIWMEEKKLVRRHGRAYLEYREKVSALIPVKWAAAFLSRRN